MTTYRVPFENGESAFTEKRSRFISHIWRVETEAEARERIEEMKKRYYDAATTAGAICCRRAAWSVTPTTGSPRARRASPC